MVDGETNDMEKIDWNGKRWYEADYGWDEGAYCTTYWITFKIYKGDYMFYKKIHRFILEEGEDLQTMLGTRTKNIAKTFQL